MLMGKTPKSQLLLLLLLGLVFTSLYYLCFFKGFGIIIITISSTSLFVSFPIMILSTLFLLLKFTKKKPLSIQNNTTLIKINEAKEKNNSNCGVSEENKIARIAENAIEESEVLELEDFPSESDVSSEEQSDDFELKWKNMPMKNVGKNLPVYDSYFSESDEDDEDNLIEINLPWSEDPKPKNSGHFWHELNFNDHKSFVEVLEDFNEFNEEDNLIEIDISMGSIKCPRFEFERSKLNSRV